MIEVHGDPGSFRDPANKVYHVPAGSDGQSWRIVRGLRADALVTIQKLLEQPFFHELTAQGHAVGTRVLAADAPHAHVPLADGWAGVIEHDRIPFISYPYEWTFAMLKDAALLQLHCLETALMNGWTLKDATPFNIQWIGARPVFIDIPSFEERAPGEPWVGYQQFCTTFLIPLLLKAHLGIDYLPLIRSWIDGIPPIEATKYFQSWNILRRGVLAHIVFPAQVQKSLAARSRDSAPVRKRRPSRQSDAMVVGLVQSLTRLVRKLTFSIGHTEWSHYDRTHTYQEDDLTTKAAFIHQHGAARPRRQTWDIGCNTGTFSRVSAAFSDQVIAIDADHDAVEQLYLAERGSGAGKILPLVMNLANISPAQGWAGGERAAFDGRGKPDLVLCLALIHHMRVSANIPNAMFLRWLRSLDADIVLEFVHREDEMFEKLVANRKEQYPDYSLPQFIVEAQRHFRIQDRASLKSSKRELFFLSPA